MSAANCVGWGDCAEDSPTRNRCAISTSPQGGGRIRVAMIAFIFCFATLATARAQDLVSGISQDQVEINSSYAGTSIVVFGAIEGADNTPSTQNDVVVVIRGPSADMTVRRKARIAGTVHGVPTVGLRLFNLYGPRQNPQSSYSGVISIFADRLLRGEPIEIFGDGEQTRDFVYIADGVLALRRAMKAATVGADVFNVCTGRGTTVRALAETMAVLCRTELIVQRRPARNGDVRISIGDPRHAAAQLAFEAKTTLSEGLTQTIGELQRCRQKVMAQATA